MMINPREDFLAQQAVRKAWHEMSASMPFTRAAEVAMWEMQGGMAPPDMGTAAAMYWQLQGARRFLQILSTLTESPQVQQPKPIGNLTHKI